MKQTLTYTLMAICTMFVMTSCDSDTDLAYDLNFAIFANDKHEVAVRVPLQNFFSIINTINKEAARLGNPAASILFCILTN